MISLDNEKLELTYPCSWRYKVIVFSGKKIDNLLESILSREYKLTKSNNSKSGKYQSFNIETVVFNDEDRVFIFEELKKSELIKMVL